MGIKEGPFMRIRKVNPNPPYVFVGSDLNPDFEMLINISATDGNKVGAVPFNISVEKTRTRSFLYGQCQGDLRFVFEGDPILVPEAPDGENESRLEDEFIQPFISGSENNSPVNVIDSTGDADCFTGSKDFLIRAGDIEFWVKDSFEITLFGQKYVFQEGRLSDASDTINDVKVAPGSVLRRADLPDPDQT